LCAVRELSMVRGKEVQEQYLLNVIKSSIGSTFPRVSAMIIHLLVVFFELSGETLYRCESEAETNELYFLTKFCVWDLTPYLKFNLIIYKLPRNKCYI
jgi:hypothetical protein